MNTVSVARDFTRFPAGRYKRNGDTSGEEFRERFLEGPITRSEQLTVDLDGTVGYGSSFLEEAFGGLVRATKVPSHTVLERLHLRSSDTSLCEEITQYIVDAGRDVK